MPNSPRKSTPVDVDAFLEIDDDVEAPQPVHHVDVDSPSKLTKSGHTSKKGGVEIIEGAPPVPPAHHSLEAGGNGKPSLKKKASNVARSSIRSSANQPHIAGVGIEEARPVDAPRQSGGVENAAARPGVASRNNGDLHRDRDENLPIVPHAYLVTEGNEDVIHAHAERRQDEESPPPASSPAFVDAEPVQPWWKETRARAMLLVIFALVAGLAVALGVVFSTDTSASMDPDQVPSSTPTRHPTVALSKPIPDSPSQGPTISTGTPPSPGPPIPSPGPVVTESPTTRGSPSPLPTTRPTSSSTLRPTGKPSQEPIASTGTPTPPSLPEPIPPDDKDCIIVLQQALLNADCSGCNPLAAVDGETAVVTSNTEELKVMSQVDGVFLDELVEQMDEVGSPDSIALRGNSAAVGYPVGTGGQLILYERNPFTESWLRSGTLKPDNNNAHFGSSVAISDELMVVGAPGQNTVLPDGNGVAYVYQRTPTGSSSWRRVRRIDDPRPDAIDYIWFLGASVDVNDDLVVIADHAFGQNLFNLGVHGSKHERGAVFVYLTKHISDTSRIYTSKLQNLGECKRWFGREVALTSEGDLVVWCEDPGVVYLYPQSKEEEGRFDAPPQRIRASGEEPEDGFGHSIAVDGNVMAIGTNKESFGKVYLFTLNDGTWEEFAVIEAPMGSSYFGKSVALSGNSLIVSSSHNAYSYSLADCRSI